MTAGEWRAPSDRGGGWGLQLMRALTDAVDVDRTAGGNRRAPAALGRAASGAVREPERAGTVTSEHRPGSVTHLHVSGEIDLANVERRARRHPRPRPRSRPRRARPAETTYLDSAAIAMLFRLPSAWASPTGPVASSSRADSPIRAVLDLTRIDTVIPLYDSPTMSDADPRSRASGRTEISGATLAFVA